MLEISLTLMSHHSYMRHDSFMCETWLVHIWDMTRSYMRHDSFIYETRLVHMRHLVRDNHWKLRQTDQTQKILLLLVDDSSVCETWLIHVWDMTHSYVRHDSFICETCLIHMWDMTYSCMRHDSALNVSFRSESCCLIHMWDMTHSYVRHDSFI